MQTFLFTDIEDSTRLWQQFPLQMSAAAALHDGICRDIIARHSGEVVKTTGDGFHASFDRAEDAAGAAVSLQNALREPDWGVTGELKIRMGLHSGEAERRDGDFYGTAVNKAARIMSLAAGSQILLSDATCFLLKDHPPPDVRFKDLGSVRMKGLAGKTGIYQLVHPTLQENFPPLVSIEQVPNNIPGEMTSFIGREHEKARIIDLLLDTKADQERWRLVTLIGPGGTGKTRLSIRVARDIRDGFPDGVWFLELAPLTDPKRIPYALADVLNLQEVPGVSVEELIANYLRERQALLVFDNCEHLVEASARLIEELLRAAPLVQIMASSREAIGIYGENVVRVPSLPLPDEDAGDWDQIASTGAVKLFIERGRMANAERWFTPENGPAIAQICRRLDGIPLALELAAARLRVFSPAQILERLDDRFRLLTGGSRTALPRLQTLQALIDWSYQLLSEEEKTLFQELSVFAGGWTIEMAFEICQGLDVLDLLPQLVDKSLVTAEPFEDGMRYVYLETMRQYARDRLMESGRSAELRNRHLDYLISLTAPDPAWNIRQLHAYIDMHKPNLENFRVALSWGLTENPFKALELAGNLTVFWSAGYPREGLSWLEQAERAVDKAGVRTSGQIDPNHLKHVEALAHQAKGLMLQALGQDGLAIAEMQKARTIYEGLGKRDRLMIPCTIIGIAAVQQGDMEIAEEALETALKLGEELGNLSAVATLLNMKGLLVLARDRDLAAARELMEEGLRLDQSISVAAAGLFPLIKLEMLTQNWDRARELVETSLEAVKNLPMYDKRRYYSMYISERGHVERLSGNLEAAQRIYAETIQIFQELSMDPAVAHLLECFAMISLQKGRLRRAARLFGAAEVLRERVQTDMTALEKMEYAKAIRALKDRVNPEDLSTWWQDGRGLSTDAAISAALDFAAEAAVEQ